ncbi:MAG: hydroxypyruvate isomerase [Deltaproteobacteria bacterium RBG_16_49_23]|nr:MAG: hydroxypyruvate isomerase [Deltaproteobacteria bacterium RBG_16_49_23]
MPKFSANLTMLFNEVDFLDRFEWAAKTGFKGVEYLFPYAWKKEQLVGQLNKHDLVQVLHNLPAGNWQAGERGIACLPGREGEFQDGVGTAIEYAKALGCPRLNCLVGKLPQGVSSEKVRQALVDNLRFAAGALEKEGIRLLIEPLNDQDIPGFYLVHIRDTLRLFEEVDRSNLYLQYDIYHMQIMEGNLTKTILSNLARIGHIQVADIPGRHEPGTGEINFTNLFRFVDEAGYDGWIGCEYIPAGKTEDGLKWIKPYLK